MADHGYDVADPRDRGSVFGSMSALQRSSTAHIRAHQGDDCHVAQPHQLAASLVSAALVADPMAPS